VVVLLGVNTRLSCNDELSYVLNDASVLLLISKVGCFAHKTLSTYFLVFAFVGHVLFLFVYNEED
jgi:hypothetical protein